MDVSRYVDTTELKFEVEFITPCFLGGADSNAEIRVAPFKNLIRRWWRIANGHLSPEELWKKESELFGSTQKNPDIVEENKNKKSSEKQPEIFGKSKVELKILDKEKCKISKNRNLLFPNEKLTLVRIILFSDVAAAKLVCFITCFKSLLVNFKSLISNENLTNFFFAYHIYFWIKSFSINFSDII